MPGAQDLIAGYAQGIFVMADSADSPVLRWVCPERRGLLPIGGVHAARSLRRDLRRGGWSAHLDGDFDAMVAACAGRDETWINAPLRRLYNQLHDHGFAHALEIRYHGAFAGGLFGITLGQAFMGESMVSLRPNGSKMALLWLSSHLARCGFTLCDTQFLTPHLASMGGYEMAQADYVARLARAIRRPADFHAAPLPDADQLLHEISQTS